VYGVGVGAVCNSPLRLAMLSALYIKVKPLQLARQRLIILCRQSVVCFVAELHSYALAWEQGIGNWESGICCGLVMDSADQLAHAWLIDFGKNYPRILVPMGLVSGNRGAVLPCGFLRQLRRGAFYWAMACWARIKPAR